VATLIETTMTATIRQIDSAPTATTVVQALVDRHGAGRASLKGAGR
jgi:hypothetical protein